MRKGFTLIELVMIIVILGILAAVAIPRYFDLQQQAQQSAEEGIVGGVRAGISTYYANQCATASCAFPASLDAATAAACSSTNPCFGTILSQTVTTDWAKAATFSYTGPDTSTGLTYSYDASDGSFEGS